MLLYRPNTIRRSSDGEAIRHVRPILTNQNESPTTKRTRPTSPLATREPISAAYWEANSGLTPVATRPRLSRHYTSDTRGRTLMDIHSASDAQKPSPKVTKSTLGPYATLKATAEKTVEDEPLLGEIYLPGKPIVSHNHHALERFQAWEKENRSYVSRLSTRKRWDLYITNRDLDGIRNPVDASLIMASLQTIKPSRLAKVV